MTKLTNPLPQFLDSTGALMDGGYIYVGVPGADPEVSPITTYWDTNYTVPTGQLRTLGGVIVNGATPANVYFPQQDYSIRTRDQNGAQIFYSGSLNNDAAAYQPSDADLTAIAALATTPFGRSLLTLADQNALVTATGIQPSVPVTGGTIQGVINRGGAGAYAFGLEAGLTGMRIWNPRPIGAANPTGAPGDIIGFY